MKRTNRASAFPWQRAALMVLCVLLALVLFVLLFATAYIQYLLSLVTDDGSNQETLPHHIAATATEPEDHSTQFTGPSVPSTTVATLPSTPSDDHKIEGIINILITGEDRSPGEERQRSDSIILCSFNTEKNTFTMISFLRDTYVAIPGYWHEKINAAYQYGGVNTLNETLAANFGVHVDGNVMVDFEGFVGVIDLLGGVDINLTQAEVDYLNGAYYTWNLEPGMQRLDGEKALAYSRIRYIDADAYRAQRQRNVITSLINRYKSLSVSEMLSLTTQILESGFIKTNMTSDEIITYVTQLFPMFASATINNQQIPVYGTYEEMSVGDLTYCKVPDLVANREILEAILKND